MTIAKLAHYSVRTRDLAASLRFYTEILGFRTGYRPPFAFPGLWLYRGDDEAEHGIVHLIGIGRASEKDLRAYLGGKADRSPCGTGALDHIAFRATDWLELRGRCELHGVAYVERVVPVLGLLQVFLTDPSGVTIELNYAAEEASADEAGQTAKPCAGSSDNPSR